MSPISSGERLVKLLRIFLACLVLLIGLTSILQAQDATPEAEATVSVLFVQSGSSGTMTISEDGGYLLTIEDVDPYVLWFTDRPQRGAGYIPLGTYLELWTEGSDSFQTDAPNGSLIVNGEPIAVEIMNPVYDTALNSFRYTVVPLDNTPLADTLSLEIPSLFIDSDGIVDSFIQAWG
jgi:hypothetical protein